MLNTVVAMLSIMILEKIWALQVQELILQSIIVCHLFSLIPVIGMAASMLQIRIFLLKIQLPIIKVGVIMVFPVVPCSMEKYLQVLQLSGNYVMYLLALIFHRTG